jgi:hypothetical protein
MPGEFGAISLEVDIAMSDAPLKRRMASHEVCVLERLKELSSGLLLQT